ncbi:MAG: 16S rRNA (cytosine(1402)-N(4))-methyltransferase [Armatimonadetes bacterium 55-13]|nr:16S rRNA (cytosine(1402)-N(4))-methyltransferase RsmH [Armatimonadota bacterium]OJU64797.1 MAG: 16S rRNA (cytosine(1402)-N(4))-methyltransferase [Armatimonadetes bacterium 55-13]
MALEKHDPVMLQEVLEVLPLESGGVAVDGTLGLAGHAKEFARRVSPGGKLVGTDWDESMLAIARERLMEVEGVEKILIHADYRGLAEALNERGLEADGILLDLGLNSAQIEDSERGIAFKEAGPLDMRMDRSSGEPASSMLNRMSLDQIEQILWEYGDERWARAIARKIVERRKDEPLRTTQDLVDCVLAAIPVKARDKRIHPATRTFQAVRIAVNRELEDLEETFVEIAGCLKPGGVMAVLSYHSGEDRAIKRASKELIEDGFEELFKKPKTPTAEEIARNPRSRSAKLRAVRRIERETS